MHFRGSREFFPSLFLSNPECLLSVIGGFCELQLHVLSLDDIEAHWDDRDAALCVEFALDGLLEDDVAHLVKSTQSTLLRWAHRGRAHRDRTRQC